MILRRFGCVSAVSGISDGSGGDVFEEVDVGPRRLQLNNLDYEMNLSYALLFLDCAENVRPVTRDASGGDVFEEFCPMGLVSFQHRRMDILAR